MLVFLIFTMCSGISLLFWFTVVFFFNFVLVHVKHYNKSERAVQEVSLRKASLPPHPATVCISLISLSLPHSIGSSLFSFQIILLYLFCTHEQMQVYFLIYHSFIHEEYTYSSTRKNSYFKVCFWKHVWMTCVSVLLSVLPPSLLLSIFSCIVSLYIFH